MSTFSGLNVSRLGMQAQQKALEVTAHNVANANTPGYSRQVARMVATTPMSYPDGEGMLGSGVKVEEIARIRDEFLDMQIRGELQTHGNWHASCEVLTQIEGVFMEPTTTGFNSVITNFFNGWQELSLNPEGTPVRAALVENANALVNSIKHVNEQLKTIRSQIDTNVSLKVTEVNSLATQIKDLNSQIITLVSLNETPGDLMDRRDILVDRLSELIEFTALSTPRGSLNIYIGGRSLVNENSVHNLAVEPSEGMVEGWPVSPQIVWERDNRVVNIGNGEIGGLQSVRDTNLKDYMQTFESMAWGIITEVNAAHSQGMDLFGDQGTNFFTGTHLENLAVSDEIKANVGKIAAAALPDDWSEPGAPNAGDGNNALQIAQLRNASMVEDTDAELQNRLRLPADGETGITTFENFYKDLIARLGVDSQESSRMSENQQSLIHMMQERKESISGVSLDEELANMIQFQLAYQASARMITAFDELFDTVINRMIR
ncbi:MAG: flagellar hook-associated protein FlgK [Firmicutes bacterium]|nr:flagellar hook-associated protein FlgK [Bacillota bacterium]